MNRFSTISLVEACCAALLCLYAINASRGADPVVPDATQRYAAVVARANALYHKAQAACEEGLGDRRDLCFREAKATLVATVSEARASR
jgi:hypothetical protein